jgi:hypothetical protein
MHSYLHKILFLKKVGVTPSSLEGSGMGRLPVNIGSGAESSFLR